MNTLGEFTHFRVHIDNPDFSMETFLTFLHTNSDVVCIVRECGIRPHVHCTISLKVAKSTFIDRLHKSFPFLKGNGSFSCKKVREYDNNLRYCYKGKANDYPDVIYSTHSAKEQKEYYVRYWETFKSNMETKKVSKAKSESEFDGSVVITKAKSKTFMMKVSDKLYSECKPLCGSIWHYEGASEFTAVNSLEFCQEYLANYLYKEMGNSVKNLDDMIFSSI